MTYEPTLQSVRQHEVPKWFQDAKFGIFVLDRDDIIISYQPQSTNNIRSLGFTVERVVYRPPRKFPKSHIFTPYAPLPGVVMVRMNKTIW